MVTAEGVKRLARDCGFELAGIARALPLAEDSGRYLYEEMSGYKRNYSRLTFIRTGLEVDDSFRQRAQAEAAEKGWKFEEFDGSTTLFRRLLSGDWTDEFLVVQPGEQIVASNDDQILSIAAASPEPE